MNFTKQLIAIGVLVALSLATLRAQDTLYWTGDTDTVWSKNTNWSATPGGSAATAAPTSTTTVVFTAGATNNCAADVAVSVAELLILDNTTADLYLYGNTLAVSGNFTQHAGVFQGSTANIAIGGLLHLIGGEFHATTGTTSIADGIIEEGPYFSPHGGKVSITGTGATLDMSGFFYDLQIATGASAELVNSIQVANNLDLDGPIDADVNVIVLGNDAPGAISGSSGVYFSIGAGPIGLFIWLIGENTGTYTLPFLATTSGPVIPVEVAITTAGDGPDGALLFSCIELDDTKPQDLLGDGVGYYNATGGNNADYNLNRMWLNIASDYTISPVFDLELSYTTADLSGISATEANLKAQAYDELHWGELLGTVNTTANTLALTGHALPTDGRANFVTLVDNTSPNKSTYGGKTGLTCADAIEIGDEEPELTIDMSTTEMWFKFTATDAIANIMALRNDDHSPFYLNDLEVYSGSCGGLSLIGDTIVSPDSFILEKVMTSLTVSETYYVKLLQPSGRTTTFRWPTSTPGELATNSITPILNGVRFVCQPNIRGIYSVTNVYGPIFGGLRPSYRYNVSGGTIVSQEEETITIDWDDPDVGGELSVSIYFITFRPTTVTLLQLVPCCRGVSGDIVVTTMDVSQFITSYSSGNPVFTTTDEVVFNGTLTINSNFTISSCPNIKFGPDAKIVVPSGKTFTVDESVLKAGCSKMWDGIEVLAGGTLIVTDSEVWDAKTAVRSIDGGAITLEHSSFINNFRGVHVSGASGGFVYPAFIDGCTFDGSGPLLAPHNAGSGDFGLIGDEVTPFLLVGSNTFDQNEWFGFQTAISITKSNSSIENNYVHDLEAPYTGVTVNNRFVNTLNYSVNIENNSIEDCLSCIDVEGYRSVEITDNNITAIDNEGFGIRVSSQQQITTNCSGIVRINDNDIYNSRMGIISFNYTCIDHEIENNLIDNSASDIDDINFVQGITISSLSSYTPRPPYSLGTITNVNFNNILHTHTGILVSARPLLAQISRNNIQVMLNLSGERKYGTRLFQSHAATVSCNNVESVVNTSTPSPSLSGRIPEIYGNYQNNSLLAQVLKNEIIQTGAACVIDGSCDYSTINENNWIDGNLNSFVLQNSGVVYQQGWSSSPRLNWFSMGGYATGTSLQSHLYANGSDGRVSPFWLRGNNNDAYHPGTFVSTPSSAPGSFSIPKYVGANSGELQPCALTLEIFNPEFNEPAIMGILLDTIPFDDDSITYKWWGEWNTYYVLGFFDSIADTDSIYIDFLDAYEANSVMAALEPLRLSVWEYNVDEAGSTDYENLLQDLSDITPANAMEETTRDMARYVLKWKQGTLDGTDEDAIEGIAELCAFYGGPGVLEARNFLSAFDMDLWHFDWEDGCIMPTSKRDIEQRNDIVEKNRKIYDLYPNPTTGNIQVVWSEIGGNMEIYSLLGQKIKEYPLVEGSNEINLATEHLGNGIFVVKFVIGIKTIGTEKLVISR
jgi:hypothetical protein